MPHSDLKQRDSFAEQLRVRAQQVVREQRTKQEAARREKEAVHQRVIAAKEAATIRAAAAAEAARRARRQEAAKARRRTGALRALERRCIVAAWRGLKGVSLKESDIEWASSIAPRLGLQVSTEMVLTDRELRLIDLLGDHVRGLDRHLLDTPRTRALLERLERQPLAAWSGKLWAIVALATPELHLEQQTCRSQVNAATAKLCDFVEESRRLRELAGLVVSANSFLRRKEVFERDYIDRLTRLGGLEKVPAELKKNICRKLLLEMGHDVTDPVAFFRLVAEIESGTPITEVQRLQIRVELLKEQEEARKAEARVEAKFKSLQSAVAALQQTAHTLLQREFVAKHSRSGLLAVARDKQHVVKWEKVNSSEVQLPGHLAWLTSDVGQRAKRRLLKYLEALAAQGQHAFRARLEVANNATVLQTSDQKLRIRFNCSSDALTYCLDELGLGVTFRQLRSGGIDVTARW